MHGLTYLGGAFVLTAATLALVSIFLFVCRRRADALVLGVCMLGAFGLSQLLKTSFHRPRPPLPWLVGTSGYSFPSGHALLTMSLFGFLAYLAMRHGRRSFPSLTGIVALLSLPVLVGVSRVYLGVHYPTDVLGGWIVAVAWVGTCIMAREFLTSKKGTAAKSTAP